MMNHSLIREVKRLNKMFKKVKSKLETLARVKGLGLKMVKENKVKKEEDSMKGFVNACESPEMPISEFLNEDSIELYLRNMQDIRREMGFMNAHLQNLNEEMAKREKVADLDVNVPEMMKLCSEMTRIVARHEAGFKQFVYSLGAENQRLKDELSVTKNEMSAVKAERAMILRDNSEMIQRLSKDIDSIKQSVAESHQVLNENVEGLRKEITPVLPAIHTSQQIKHGEKSGMKNPNAKIDENEFRRLAEEEMLSASEIARRLNVSVPAVTKKAKKMGIILVKGSNNKGLKNW